MNDSKVAGTFNDAKGSVKQAVGETFNDQSLANEGAADQVKGKAQQAWGSAKDAVHNLTHSDTATDEKLKAEDGSHKFRDEITNAAESVKNSIQSGLGHLEHKAKD